MIYLIITTLIWSFSFGIIGSTLKGLDSLQLADTRLILAFIVFLPFLKFASINFKEKTQLMMIGAVQFGIMYSCYISAYRFLPSHLVALFSIMTPFYVVIINDLRQRSFSPWYLFAALISVAGAGVIKAGEVGNNDIWLGFGLMQVANLAFAFGQVYYRDWKLARPHLKDANVFGFLYLGAAIFTAVAALLISQKPPIPMEATSTQWFALVFLGVVASGLGFFCWNKGGTQTSVGVLAAFNNAVVPLAMFASLFVFGEADNISSESLIKLAAGSALIIGALVLAKRKSA
ncbi:DMT family transporter [Marinomonas sp.]|nr:EamA family transporter [Marinomonas sp.]MDB4838164.1 DMT family transporter [Marinomonas sp.]